MGRRRKARESTLQILFQLEFDDSPPEAVIQQYWQDKKASREEREFSDWLVEGIVARKKAVDSIIQSVSEHWRISRMVIIDRNILRMAVYELFFAEDTAPAVVMNEAIEIAKKFSGSESATFINGILDALHKKSDEVKKAFEDETHDE